MAKLVRYTGNLLAFAANATGTNRTVFGGITQSDTLDANVIADWLTGWEIVSASENPTKQDFNAMGFTLGQLLAYLHQVGVAEWDSLQEYHIDSMANRNGAIYVSLTNTNVGNDPATDTTNWLIIAENSLVDEVVVSGGAVTQIDFTGLDINSHKSYVIVSEIINATASQTDVSLYVNGDITATNYYSHFEIANAGVITSGRDNNAGVYTVPASGSLLQTLNIALVGGYSTAHGVGATLPAASMTLRRYATVKTATVTNITSLSFVSTIASAIADGSRIRIYREDT